jgi:hypothetical protein
VKPYHTTTLVQRIADGFKSLYSNNDLKLFKGGNPFFKSLPKEIKNILLHDFQNLLEPDFNTITKLDPLNVPTAISFTDTVEKNSFSSPNLREGHAASHKNKSRSPQDSVTDPDPQQKNLNTESDQDKTPILENNSDLKNESDSENEDENVADPGPDPEQDSDSETLVNENIGNKQLRSGKIH